MLFFNENQLPISNITNNNKPKITKALKVNYIYKQIMFFCIKKEDYVKINLEVF